VGKWAKTSQSLINQGFTLATFVFKSGLLVTFFGQMDIFSQNFFVWSKIKVGFGQI
jgi:hypothetical protein